MPNTTTFDRHLLPPALFEFVVISDTHFILNPKPYAVEFDSVRRWPARVERALDIAAALEAKFVIHLGDLTEENPAKPEHEEARQKALEQIRRSGLQPYHIPGNMDIGDKPDATMFADWVSQETLDIYQRQLGPSWYSFDHHGIHFVALNSQIMNGSLPAATDQKAWLENDLEQHRDKRIFLFMHLPPFFVDRTEPDRGFYNSLDEPARSWLLELLAAYEVELLFCGHTHFRVINKTGTTQLRVCASTTTSRAGFYEAFSISPPEDQGRNDDAKLGFYLIRVFKNDCSVHFIRTEISGNENSLQRSLLTLNSKHLASPVGTYLRRPLAHLDEGSVAWPSALRQRVRDDHPFLACTEAGLGHVRVPASDLSSPLQRERLQLLREQGVNVTAFWLWRENLPLRQLTQEHVDILDAIEVQVTGAVMPEQTCLAALAECHEILGKTVVLTPYLAREVRPGKYHPRARIGYKVDEISQLHRHLEALDTELDRVICNLDDTDSPIRIVRTLSEHLPSSRIRGYDLVAELAGTDEQSHANRAAEAVFAAAADPNLRIFISPFVDLDRTNDVSHGLLDRLSNPRPAYHVVRSLNSLLFAGCDRQQGVRLDGKLRTAASYTMFPGSRGSYRYVLITAASVGSRESRNPIIQAISESLPALDTTLDLFDVVNAASHLQVELSNLDAALADSDGPWLLRFLLR